MQDSCSACDGIGMICLCCDHAIDDCECGPGAEPCPCERCDGSGREPIDPDILRENAIERRRMLSEECDVRDALAHGDSNDR